MMAIKSLSINRSLNMESLFFSIRGCKTYEVKPGVDQTNTTDKLTKYITDSSCFVYCMLMVSVGLEDLDS